MISHKPRIAVIGAGILGSAITYSLAIRGADVVLFDEASGPGCGVTGRAFGWINIINGTPGEPSYTLWREAIVEYDRLRVLLPQALSSARAGSLFWKATTEETMAFAARHRQAGEDVELLEGSIVAEWEPRLRRVPECAVFSRKDLALDPAQLAGDFVAAAIAAGASTQFGRKIEAIETVNGRVTGITVSRDVLKADAIVMAAGGGVKLLTDGLGIDTGIATSPALLLRYLCSAPVISHILRNPRLEIRQANDNTLFVAKSYIDDGCEDGPRLIGERTLTVMKDELDLPNDVTLARADVGERPVFADGLPRLGFLPQFKGLYLAAGHPGVILAPLIGRLAAEEILDGRRSGLMPSPG